MALTAVLSACTKGDYVNAIPENSRMLMSIDMQQMKEEGQMADDGQMLKKLFHTDDLSASGLDLKEKVYLFISADGNLGLCAKVDDAGKVEDWLNSLASQGTASKVKERRGYRFSVVGGTWVLAFSDESLLVSGPVVAAAQAEMQQQMARLLSHEEDDEGMRTSRLFQRLDSLPSAMAMVGHASALPEQFVAPFTLGAPKGSDASQIMIAAELHNADRCLEVEGETFSFNASVDAALKKAAAVYRPIKGTYVASMAKDALAGMFLNVDGNAFLPLMQTNKGIQTLLMGINTAIDMDNIMRSVDGDMAIMMPSMGNATAQLMMAAQLKHSRWLADVDYWKESCPSGGRITDWGKNAFCYTDGKTSYWFGVDDKMQYYSGSSRDEALASIRPAKEPISETVRHKIVGRKMVMVLNMNGVGKDQQMLQTFASMMTPLFGEFDTILYSLK